MFHCSTYEYQWIIKIGFDGTAKIPIESKYVSYKFLF
nr:MAG TPA: hypothetical protein [Caudoviricetes sp.]